MSFKMRNTDTPRYEVKPTVGQIEPQDKVVVQIRLGAILDDAGKDIAEPFDRDRQKFQILYVTDPNYSFSNQKLSQPPQELIMSIKIPCVFQDHSNEEGSGSRRAQGHSTQQNVDSGSYGSNHGGSYGNAQGGSYGANQGPVQMNYGHGGSYNSTSQGNSVNKTTAGSNSSTGSRKSNPKAQGTIKPAKLSDEEHMENLIIVLVGLLVTIILMNAVV